MSHFSEFHHENGWMEIESFGSSSLSPIYVATYDNSPNKSFSGESCVRLTVTEARILIQSLRQAVADATGEQV